MLNDARVDPISDFGVMFSVETGNSSWPNMANFGPAIQPVSRTGTDLILGRQRAVILNGQRAMGVQSEGSIQFVARFGRISFNWGNIELPARDGEPLPLLTLPLE
jgi:hypothetical protein